MRLVDLVPTSLSDVAPGDLVEGLALTDAATESAAPTGDPLGAADSVAAARAEAAGPETAALAGATGPIAVGDLTGSRVLASSLSLSRTPEVVLRRAGLDEVVLEQPDIPVLRAPYSQWRDVAIEGGRLGSAEAYDAEWTRVLLRGVRVRYLNLRGAQLRDVSLVDCTIDELDLGGAELQRVALPGTRVQRLEVTGARLVAVDLRGSELLEIVGAGSLSGAYIDAAQLHELAPVLAAELGIRVLGS